MDYSYENDELDFTSNDLDVMYDTVDSKRFRDQDSLLIYETLRKKLVQRSFGDYLKRYICRKAGLDGNWQDIPLNDYRRIIMDSFEDNNTPASFTSTTVKLSSLTKNWLTQSTVKRQVVFLLGFGLRMSTEDVSNFLIKALHERDINPKNPFELICWYCYQHRYGYSKFVQLKNVFDKMPPSGFDVNLIYSEKTVRIRSSYSNISDDAVFLSKLSNMKTDQNIPLFSYTAKNMFDSLYYKVRLLIADYFNRDEIERTEGIISEYLKKSEYSDRLGEAEIKRYIANIKSEMKIYSEKDVTPGDVEKVICASVPMDGNGNLWKSNRSSLNSKFSGRRFSRQHITDILQSKIEVDRFDLITLNFFIFSQKNSEYIDSKVRFLKFLDDTNDILNQCSMGEMLITNPYECFIMMCMLSDDPLGTYADVIEMSYE